MPNRILKESICSSENINVLSQGAELFFYRLLVQCDDFGRYDARPAILRAECFPLRVDTITRDMVAGWLQELVDADLVWLYEYEGLPYLQITKWSKHQQTRANRSKWPEPPEDAREDSHVIADDSTCNQVQSDAPENRESIHDTRESIHENRARVVAPEKPQKPPKREKQDYPPGYADPLPPGYGEITDELIAVLGDLPPNPRKCAEIAECWRKWPDAEVWRKAYQDTLAWLKPKRPPENKPNWGAFMYKLNEVATRDYTWEVSHGNGKGDSKDGAEYAEF